MFALDLEWVDIWKTLVLFTIALSWMKLCEYVTLKKFVSHEASRKLVHIGIGSLFVLCWNIYDVLKPDSRFLAVLVPLSVTLKLTLVGLGLLKDEKTIKMLCRVNQKGSNHRPERQILSGPLAYGVVIMACTLAFWPSSGSVVGIVTLAILCAGDGFAALIGQRSSTRRIPIPYNSSKSLQGSIAFVLFSFAFSIAFWLLFSQAGWPVPPVDSKVLFVVCTISAVVESLPVLSNWDNVTVPISALVSLVLCGY